ncbi:hypothetical protein DFH29DRAFT_880794 [Suillus ampliporus]|nr:hypothetical protein DFH29DRAFT_883664 [Suillus ampliporus]KAG0692763.1 hypothetical protein DFH29DRAFT_882084 [Suillus ampliporus]KAG0694314.1 hypothetical protein DFH29DRAFT_880794 [Suillus ampliporus]
MNVGSYLMILDGQDPFLIALQDEVAKCHDDRGPLISVVPSIAPQELIHMTVLNMVIDIANVLGITKKISAKDSTMFAQEIRIYIDSNDKRGDEKNKNEYSHNPLINTGAKKTNHGPALWPLIREVKVRCNAKALSTFAILVDFPVVTDVNAARNSIAKDYMEKCDCICILVPMLS